MGTSKAAKWFVYTQQINADRYCVSARTAEKAIEKVEKRLKKMCPEVTSVEEANENAVIDEP